MLHEWVDTDKQVSLNDQPGKMDEGFFPLFSFDHEGNIPCLEHHEAGCHEQPWDQEAWAALGIEFRNIFVIFLWPYSSSSVDENGGDDDVDTTNGQDNCIKENSN